MDKGASPLERATTELAIVSILILLEIALPPLSPWGSAANREVVRW